MKFLKIKAFVFLFVVKLISKIFVVELPPLVSVTALINKDGKLLFLDLTYLKGLGLPGGMMKKGETATEALKREVAEETGFEITNHSYLWSIPSSFRGFATLSLVFEVEITGEMRNSKEGKLLWLSPTEAKGKLAYASAEEVLKKYVSI